MSSNSIRCAKCAGTGRVSRTTRGRKDTSGLGGPTPTLNAAGGYKVTGLGAAQRWPWPYSGRLTKGTLSPCMTSEQWHEMIVELDRDAA